MTIERRSITDRAEWLNWRSKTIGASEVPIVCGVSPYKTPLRLYAEKTGQVAEPDPTATMKRGLMLEAAVIAYVQDEHPDWIISRPNVWLYDPETRLSCTPDAIARKYPRMKDTLLQLKVISRPIYDRDWKNPDPDGEDAAPAMYVLQTLTEMMLTEVHHAYIAALVIDTFSAELRMFDVPRHPGAELRILKCVGDFWADVEAGREPKADYAKDLGLLETLYPPDEGRPGEGRDVLDLTSDNRLAEILAEDAILRNEININEKRRDAIKAEVIEKLHGAVHAFTREYKITRKTTHRPEHLVAAKSFPVLRITERKPS